MEPEIFDTISQPVIGGDPVEIVLPKLAIRVGDDAETVMNMICSPTLEYTHPVSYTHLTLPTICSV